MDKLSKKVVAQLCTSGVIQEDDREVYEYSLNILLIGVFHTLTVLLIGFVFGMFIESIVLFASFFLARKFAGGFHMPKHWQCYLFTIATVSGALFLARVLLMQSDIIYYAVIGVSAAVIFVLAPIGHPNKPLSLKEMKVYRLISWALCVLLTGLSLVFFHWFSRSIGLGIGMGIVLCAFALALAAVEKRLKKVRSNMKD